MSPRSIDDQLEHSRRRMNRLRDHAERLGLRGDAPLFEAIEELGHALEELSVSLEELSCTNEELAEARLASEMHAQRYLELFRFAPDAYVVTDAQGVIRELNAIAEQKLGRPAHYLSGKPLLTLVAPDDRDAFLDYLAAVQKRGGRVEDRLIRFGAGAGFEASVLALREPRGEDLEIRWLLRDGSERRRVEKALQASEARIRGMLEAALDGIFSVDAAGVIRSANAAMSQMFGYEADELVGRELAGLFGTSLSAPGAVGAEFAGIRRDGSRFPVQISIGEERPKQDQGFVAIVRDLSRLRSLESQVRAATAAIAVAEEHERQRLAADLHDDVGQLLSLAGLKLGMLRGAAAADPGLATRLREVEECVSRAQQRTESMTFQLSPPILRDMGLAAAAEWLAEDMKRSYGLRVRVQHGGEPALEEAARIAVFRSLRELLINVARHAKVGEARVSLAQDEGAVTVAVVDQGVGFDPARSGGFGLLSLRQRLEALGGRFEIESAPGRGTHASLVLPLPAR